MPSIKKGSKGQVSKGKFLLSVVDWEKPLRGNFTN